MTDAEWAAQAKALLAGPDEPEAKSPQKTRAAPSESKSDEELGIGSGTITHKPTVGDRIGMAATPEEAAGNRSRRPTDPMEGDPLAAGIVAGIPAAATAGLAAPALEAAGAPALLARTLAGSAGGAESAALTGGDPRVGALVGGGASALPGAANLVRKGAENIEKNAGAAEANAAYRAFGRAGNTASQEKLEAIGPMAVRDVLKKYDIPAAPGAARAALKAAREKVGSELGADGPAYDGVRKLGGDIELAKPIKQLDELQARWGKTTGTQPFAADVAELRSKLLKTYGERGAISPGELNAEIGAIENGAYAGSYSNPTAAKTVQRVTAKQLDSVLQRHLDEVAAKPGGAEAISRLRSLNSDYRTLKTLAPIAQKETVKKTFAESTGEKALHDPKAAAMDIASKVVTAPLRAGAAAVRGAAKGAAAVATPVARAMETIPVEARPEAPVAAAVLSAVHGRDRNAAIQHLVQAVTTP